MPTLQKRREVVVQLPTQAWAWGKNVKETDVPAILDRFEEMLRVQFGSRVEFIFERTDNPSGNGIHPDLGFEPIGRELHEWICDNQSAAL